MTSNEINQKLESQTEINTNKNADSNEDLNNNDSNRNNIKKKDLIVSDNIPKRKTLALNADKVVYKYYKKEKSKNGLSLCIYIWYFFLSLIFVLVTHFLKPLCVILELVFLTRISDIRQDPFVDESSQLRKGVKIVCYIVIFLLPFINIMTVIRTISIQKIWYNYIFAGILSLIELIFQIPLTFLYSNNLFSIFLIEEAGLLQLLNPWLIFFPTEYVLSYPENLRQIIESGIFLWTTIKVYYEIKDNYYESFNIVFDIILMLLLAIKFVVAVVLLLNRCCKGNRKRRGRRTGFKTNENEQKKFTEKYLI